MLSWALKSRGLLPIGLDIGNKSIKMIQLLVNGEQLSVIAAQKARIDHGINDEQEKKYVHCFGYTKNACRGPLSWK